MNSPEVKAFIRKHSSLFWYIPEEKKEDISNELLVETIFNYGTLDDVRELINILGLKQINSVFFGLKGREKLNYYPEIYNYFYLMLSNYAPRDSFN